jgi:hypothetical protein
MPLITVDKKQERLSQRTSLLINIDTSEAVKSKLETYLTAVLQGMDTGRLTIIPVR